MAYIIRDQQAGWQPIATIDTTKNHPLGTRVKALDPTYGEGEFIYLLGVASTVAGSWVTYAPDNFATALIVPNAVGPVAVAVGANVASSYGWYQIYGKHPAAKAADVADNGKVFIDTAAGICDDAAVLGDKVYNAVWASADETAGGTAEVELFYPFVNDASTFST